MLDYAWDWLADGDEAATRTAYRSVFGAVQLIASAIDPEDEEMAIAAIGAVLGSIQTQRPDLNVPHLVETGFSSAQDVLEPVGGVQ